MRANGSDFIFDPFKPGPRDQLPQVLAELRERFPVYRTNSDIWVVSRFDDVKAVQSNPQQFSSRPNPYEGSAPPDEEMKPEVLERLLALAAGIPVDMAEMASAKTIAAADPPQHTRMRRIVSRGFTPPRIKEMATAIEEIVERCVAGIEDQPAFDVVERLAVPLPVEMICHILGIDGDHYSPGQAMVGRVRRRSGWGVQQPRRAQRIDVGNDQRVQHLFRSAHRGTSRRTQGRLGQCHGGGDRQRVTEQRRNT